MLAERNTYQPTRFGLRHLVLGPAAVTLAWGQLRFAGYIKDDAFITLRYALNVANGDGLVFNPGTAPLEGYSNFLWMLLAVPGHWVGLDAGNLVRGLSLLATLLAVGYGYALSQELCRERSPRARVWTALVATTALAAHPTVLLWGQGGLEAPLLAAAFAAAFYHAARARADGGNSRAIQLSWATVWTLIACLTRPEGHLLVPALALYLWAPSPAAVHSDRADDLGLEPLVVGALVFLTALAILGPMATDPGPWSPGPALVWIELATALPIAALATIGFWAARVAVARFYRRRPGLDGRRAALRFAVIAVGVLAIYHGFRLWTFRDLWPNPAHVKTAGGMGLWPAGATALRTFLTSTTTGVALVVVALGMVSRERPRLRRTIGTVIAVFVVYFVSVGGDDMFYARLLLPMVALATVIASSTVVPWIATRWPTPRWIAPGSAVVMAILALVVGLGVVERDAPLLRNVAARLDSAHRDMARHIRSISEPGTVVVFQDMGVAPYQAPDLYWLDSIGLVDRTIALARAKAGNHPHRVIATEPSEGLEQARFRAAMRDYMLARKPRWIAGIAYLDDDDRAAAAAAFERGDMRALEELCMPALRNNNHYHRLFSDQRLARDYRFEGAWQRNHIVYLLLYQRLGDRPGGR